MSGSISPLVPTGVRASPLLVNFNKLVLFGDMSKVSVLLSWISNEMSCIHFSTSYLRRQISAKQSRLFFTRDGIRERVKVKGSSIKL